MNLNIIIPVAAIVLLLIFLFLGYGKENFDDNLKKITLRGGLRGGYIYFFQGIPMGMNNGDVYVTSDDHWLMDNNCTTGCKSGDPLDNPILGYIPMGTTIVIDRIIDDNFVWVDMEHIKCDPNNKKCGVYV